MVTMMDAQKYSHFEDSSGNESKFVKDQRLYAQLKWAVMNGQKERIDSLLEDGAPVNGSSPVYDFRSPLVSSVHLGDPEVVEKLLKRGASLNVSNIVGETALTLAAKIEKYAIVDLLLTADGLTNCHNPDDLSHLHIACMRNNVEAVKKLIQCKANVNAATQKRSFYWPGFTPLHFAVKFRCLETVEYLLSIGADITVKDAQQLTPLHIADLHRNEQVIDLILSVHTNFVSNPVNRDGLSHFMIACTRNNTEVVEFFLKIGVDLQRSGGGFHYSGLCGIDLAIYYNCVDVVKLLLLNGDHVKPYLLYEVDRIGYAYDSGNIELVDLLLTKDESLKGQSIDVKQIPRLHFSCIYESKEIVEKTLSNTPNSLNSLWNGCTPLHLAVERGDSNIVVLLLDQGADYSIKNNDGKSPLHLVFERRMDFVLSSIIGRLNDIKDNPVNKDGLSHLHIFCSQWKINSDKLETLARCVDLGFDVNSFVNINSSFWPGFTPLHFAAQFECDKIVKFLLSKGACYSAVDRSNLSAFDLAVNKTLKAYKSVIKKAFDIMEAILSYHSDRKLSSFNDRGYSLLHLLSFNRNTKMSKMRDFIRENPLDMHKAVPRLGSPVDGYTPLHFAMRYGNNKHAKLLLSQGANFLCKAANGDTPLHLAFESDTYIDIPIKLENFEILRGNTIGSTGHSLFSIACGLGNIEVMKFFLQNGVDVDSPSNLKTAPFHDKTTLHMVVHENSDSSVEAIELLLKNGANVNARDSRRNTPLHFMRRNGNLEIIDTLVSHGADINARNALFESPLFSVCIDAAYSDREDLHNKMVSFLDNGADINIADEEEVTPLTVETWFEEDEDNDVGKEKFRNTVEFLLKHVRKLETIGSYVSDTNKAGFSKLRDYFSDEIDLDEADFKTRCSEELESMMKIHTDKYTTLHDILFKNLNESAAICENDIFTQIANANDFRRKFPIYGFMLESQLKRGRARRPLLTEAQSALNFLTGKSLPQACAERILQPFTNEELHFLIVSQDTRKKCGITNLNYIDGGLRHQDG